MEILQAFYIYKITHFELFEISVISFNQQSIKGEVSLKTSPFPIGQSTNPTLSHLCVCIVPWRKEKTLAIFRYK